ncbi:hypothetical protein B0H14DRAFT_2570510 [Mycena olivaceomarginata]|nr:hypothetical protein B0H14DRAFT_2570510 [Mycena olivaceomarginata]
MAITETQKSRTIRARDKNPLAPSKPRAKTVFDYMEDNKDDSQKKVVTYFATRPDAKGGKLFFTQSALSKKLQKKAEIHSLVAQETTASTERRPPSTNSLIRRLSRRTLIRSFLRFADGEEGTPEIPEYLKLRDEDEQDEEDLQEPEFQFSKPEALNAEDFLQNIAHHRPDLDVALPLVGQLGKFCSALAQEMEEGKVRTTITSFFK